MKPIFCISKYIVFSMFIYAVLLFGSCSTPLEELTYMNNVQTGKTYGKENFPSIYKIRTNDQLFIQVISDDPLNSAFLNLVSTDRMSVGGGNTELITYLVDEEGNIAYPGLGTIKVADLTLSEIRDLLQVKVNNFLEGASVFVKQVNRTITILGEVKSPGQQSMVKNQLTIFEALGTAGDINDYGNRRTVKLIRETALGTHIAAIDMTDPQLIFLPYYYILPHDVLYVEPARKVYGAKTMPFSSSFSMIVSTISTVLLLLNVL